MERRITGYHTDEEGSWVAELDCGHRQHLRHQPPFLVRPWVLDGRGRAAHLGTPIDCRLCDRAEPPEDLCFVRRSPEWDSGNLPSGLRREHRLASGTWGRLVVREGSLTFRSSTPPIDRVLVAGDAQAIPPGVGHHIELADDARCFIEFFEVDHEEPELGGDPACWAHLFCPECGNALNEGHAAGCSLGGAG